MLRAQTIQILGDAEREQKRRQLIVKRPTYTEYVLYPLGIIVALIGKLFASTEGPDLD
jgi:hypothetical protein